MHMLNAGRTSVWVACNPGHVMSVFAMVDLVRGSMTYGDAY
jgi:hypothetical protein